MAFESGPKIPFAPDEGVECSSNCRSFCVHDGWSGAAYLMEQVLRADLFAGGSHLQAVRSARDRALATAMNLITSRNRLKRPTALLGVPGPWLVFLTIHRDQPSAAIRALDACLRIAHGVVSAGGSNLTAANLSEDELFNGRAGLLTSFLFLRSQRALLPPAHQVAVDETVDRLAQDLLNRGLAEQHDESPPLLSYSWHGKAYFGAAHGLVGICQVLLGCESTRGHPALWNTIDMLASYVSRPDGQVPSRAGGRNQSSRDEWLCQWCHGAPAIVSLLCSAHQAASDDLEKSARYLVDARRAAQDVWRRGVLTKGSNLCHGVGGNPYSFLQLHRCTGEPEYLFKAHQFARAALAFPPTTDCEPSIGLWTGALAGSLHLLLSLRTGETRLPMYFEYASQ